jgi:hypothetical protein
MYQKLSRSILVWLLVLAGPLACQNLDYKESSAARKRAEGFATQLGFDPRTKYFSRHVCPFVSNCHYTIGFLTNRDAESITPLVQALPGHLMQSDTDALYSALFKDIQGTFSDTISINGKHFSKAHPVIYGPGHYWSKTTGNLLLVEFTFYEISKSSLRVVISGQTIMSNILQIDTPFAIKR